MRNALAAALLLALAACGDGSPPGSPPVTANRVIAYAGMNTQEAAEGDWPQFFHPEWALGTPGGTLDTVSLGYNQVAGSPTSGGSLTLGLGSADDPAARACAANGPGDDLVIYENVFAVGSGGTYIEVATVSVSEDNSEWYTFAHQVFQSESSDPAGYTGFAGVTPVAEGGDRFDLQALIDAESLPADWQACYVRLVDGGTLYPDYGNTQSDLWATGADIDAVEVLHPVDAPGLTP